MVLPSQTGINVFRPSLFLALVMGLVLGLSACGGGGDVAPTPDVPASVQAGIAEALATPTPDIAETVATAVTEALATATPDISATVEAGVEATLQAIPSATIAPDAKANFNKALDYLNRGQYELAVAEFTRAIDLDPTDA